MVLLLIVLFAAIIFLEVPSLIKKKMWGELIAFSVLMSIGMFLSITQALDIKLPNPTKAIEMIFQPLAELIKS